jgi:predicted signal transduction protein with EAL and GGDEF domain
MSTTVEVIMAAALFIVGMVMIIAGLLIILAREYQETMKLLSSQTPRLAGKALSDQTVVAAIDSTTRLLEAVKGLVQTAVGVGAFLCLFGVAVCGLAFWMARLAGTF